MPSVLQPDAYRSMRNQHIAANRHVVIFLRKGNLDLVESG
jgi:hypothetical protein